MAKLKVTAKFKNAKVEAVYILEIGWKKKNKHPHLVAQTPAARMTVNDPWVATVTTKTPKPGRKNTLRVLGLTKNGDSIACISIPARSKKWP